MAHPLKTDLLKLVHEVKAGLAALPEFEFRSPDAHRSAVTVLRKALEAKGARFDGRSSALIVSYGGVRASSTSGEVGALKNWVSAAYRRLDLRSLAEG